MFKLFEIPTVYAHCDIPCGVYDPNFALNAAFTVQKMVKKLKEYEEDDLNNKVRAIMNKEEHAQKCKAELLILWTDYFKSEHLERFPDLHEKFWKAAKLCSENKQHVDEELAQQLIDAVKEIAEMFAQSKQ